MQSKNDDDHNSMVSEGDIRQFIGDAGYPTIWRRLAWPFSRTRP